MSLTADILGRFFSPDRKASAAFLGITTPQLPQYVSWLTDQVEKIILLHHSPLEASIRYQEIVRQILHQLSRPEGRNNISELIRTTWHDDLYLADYLARPEIRTVLLASSQVEDLQQADCIFLGTSAFRLFLSPDLFKPNAYLVELLGPEGQPDEVIRLLRQERPDLVYQTLTT
jgi:hypothetical protein